MPADTWAPTSHALDEEVGSPFGEEVVAIFRVGEWTVKPGREQEFLQVWRELAQYTAVRMAGARSPAACFVTVSSRTA